MALRQSLPARPQAQDRRRLGALAVDAIQHFREYAKAHLWEAAALALYTGQRMSDVLVMCWSDMDEGTIAVVQGKTEKKLWIPIHSELKTLLATLEGRLRNRLREATGIESPPPSRTDPCDQPRYAVDARWLQGLLVRRTQPACHGRAAPPPPRLPRLAQIRRRVSPGSGCSDAETAAITGQSRDMVEHYGKQVNQRRLAAAAILKWEAADAARTAKPKATEGKGGPEGGGFVQPASEFVQPDQLERAKSSELLVGAGRFELPTPSPPDWCGPCALYLACECQLSGVACPRFEPTPLQRR